MSEKFLQIRGLKKHFGNKKVLDGIDLEIKRASVTTIIGKSGIGKSVLLKCIANLLQPDAGEILLDGIHMQHNRRGAGQAKGFSFSYMFQNNALFDSLTAFENIALPLRETAGISSEAVKASVQALLEQLELMDAATRYPAELSGGMQKRVALARALITKPDIVLFDEPTTGLDPERKFGVFDMIADYRERFGFTALMVSHDIPEVFEISDHVAWLDAGKIRFFGDPCELNANSARSWSGLLQAKEKSVNL
jgi:phospholipid/cholesterol/gamma-HCH transport system ATP-binding protein